MNIHAYIYLYILRCAIADILYIMSGKPIKDLINSDIERNLKWDKNKDKIRGKVLRLNYLLVKSKEFRTIFYFREKHHGFLCKLSRIFLRDVPTIEFGNGGIGGGLIVSHYHSVIFPKNAGKNLRVGPGVVIGRNGGGFPVIGDNVYIAANATVIGNIEIGSNVIIGAGSVVTKSLDGNGVYVGNPVKMIKHIGDSAELLNEIM